MVKKPIKNKSQVNSAQSSATNTRKLFLLAFLVVVIASIGFIRFQQSKLYFRNLTVRDYAGSNVSLKVPKNWIEMEHGGTTMLHDPNVVNHDSAASILIMTYEFISFNEDSLDPETKKQQLSTLAADLQAATSNVSIYSNVRVMSLQGDDVVLADSVEDYTYLNVKKRAINVFAITNKGEIKRVTILVNEDTYERNKADMQKVAESFRWLNP